MRTLRSLTALAAALSVATASLSPAFAAAAAVEGARPGLVPLLAAHPQELMREQLLTLPSWVGGGLPASTPEQAAARRAALAIVDQAAPLAAQRAELERA